MDSVLGPTPEEVLKQVGKPAPKGLARLVKPLAVVLALGLVAGVVVTRMRAGAGVQVHYITSPVRRGDLAATVTATGTLRGRGTVTVGAETSGRVQAVHVDYNDPVKKGQVLAEIDPAPSKAALAQAKAQLAAARAEVKNADATAAEAKLNAARTRSLAAEGLASQQTLEAALAAADRAAAQAESARAQVIVAQALVESNQTALEKTQVRSPIDGVVLSRDVEVGQALAAAMQTPQLFTLARDLRDMELTIAIDEADVGRTKVGQRATFTVDAWPGRVFPGELTSIRNVAVTNDNVVTYEALLSVSNDELLLRPGMTATVTINTDERKGVLLVPNAALRFSPAVQGPRRVGFGPPGPPPMAPVVVDERPRVYVLRNGQPHEVIVEVGLTDGVHTEVSAKELEEGALVITDAEQGLSK